MPPRRPALFSVRKEKSSKSRRNFYNKSRIRDGELYVRRDALGTADFSLEEGEWYGTGDIVQIINEDPLTFVFKFRDNELVNVGGYKVNPHEVEEAAMGSGLVKDLRVYGKKNSVLGYILCCDVISLNGKPVEHELKHYLSGKLPRHQVPRIINLVEDLEITKTGKIKRS